MDVLLAFAAALVALRLAAERDAPVALAARTGAARLGSALAAFAAASGALAWGAAAGWDDRAFRAYYLFGGLLTAALLGTGSLLRIGVRVAGLVALVYAGSRSAWRSPCRSTPAVSGSEIPDAAEHLAFVPARALAIVGDVAGTVAAVGRCAGRPSAATGRERADHRGTRSRQAGAPPRDSAKAAERSSPRSPRSCCTAASSAGGERG